MWTKFIRLIAYLPQDDSTFFRILTNRQLEVTEEGKLVSRDKAESVSAREALRKQHKRQNRVRNRVSLDELINMTGAGKNG